VSAESCATLKVVANPSLTVSSASEDFGGVAVGAVATRTIVVTNTGGMATTPLSVAISGAGAADFTVSVNSCAAATLAPLGSCSITVRFAPGEVGARAAALTVTAGAGITATTSLIGNAADDAALTISPTTQSFGTIVIGSTSSATLTITNGGGLASGPLTLAVSGADAASFVLSNGCGAALAAGASCNVAVIFLPSAAGARTATVTVTGLPGGTTAAALSGNAATSAALTMNPATYDFGTVALGNSSNEHTFTITNAGGTTSGAVSTLLSGLAAADFNVASNSCGATLAAGASCAVDIRLSPSSTGSRAANLTAIAAPGGSVGASLSGTAVTPASLSASPGLNDFGSVVVGTASPAQTVTITNTGGATSGLVTPAIVGDHAADFGIVSSTCGVALSSGATCSVSVRFTPGAPGTRKAALVADAAPGGIAADSLVGNGLAPASLHIAPTLKDFGSVAAGSGGLILSLSVSNTGAVASGAVTASVTGVNASAFTIVSSSCTGALPAGGTCVVSVRFAPTVLGPLAASLVVTGAPGGNATASLIGTGATPANLTISPASANLGTTGVGVRTSVTTFVVSNTGGTGSSVINMTLTGPDANIFAMANSTCGAPLPAGGSCSVQVTATPQSTGTKSASLNAAAASGTVSASLTVTSVGTPAHMTFSVGGLNFGSASIFGSGTTQTIFIQNQGQTPGTVIPAISGTNASEFSVQSSTCGGTLGAGVTCSLTLRFEPSSLGTRTATLSLTGFPTAVAALTGTGTL
jgi:hypothetical protein